MASRICRICKRPLKNPHSIEMEMGPTCAAKSAGQTSIMPPDPDVRMLPFEGDVVVRREGHVKYMNVPQTIVQHSPTGLEWGYGGSGPADLALNILFLFTKDRKFSEQYHQEFKFLHVAALPRDGGTIPGDVILDFINERRSMVVNERGALDTPDSLDENAIDNYFTGGE